MADRMDELLGAIGEEANARIDFEAAFAGVLAKAQAEGRAACKTPARKRRWAQTRSLSMAAGAVLLLGAAVVFGRGGLMNGPGAGSAAPEAAEPQLAMSSEPAADAAPAPAAMFAAPGSPQDTGAGLTAESRLLDAPFYGTAVITVPAAGLPCGEGNSKGSDAQPAPEQALLNGSHDAHDTEGGVCMIGQTTRLSALEKLREQGYEACPSTDAHADQLAALLPGEACIALSGEIGVWNTGDGFLTLLNTSLSQQEIYELMRGAA